MSAEAAVQSRPSPKESKSLLINKIREKGEVSLRSIMLFARRQRLDFGPGNDALDVVLAWRDLGKVSIETRDFSDETQIPKVMIIAEK